MGFGSDFLTPGERFPVDGAGETRGDDHVVLELPGGPYRFSGLLREQAASLGRYFGSWCRPGPPPPATVEIRILRARRQAFRDPRPGWREYRLDLEHAPARVLVAGFYFVGRIEWEPLAATLWTSQYQEGPWLETCDNFLRVVAAYRLLKSGRVLLHSAALARDGEVFLCPGRSGAGKSTLCRLAAAAGWRVVSDELNVLAGDTVEQVPFTGDFERGEVPRLGPARPLAALCRLRQARRDRLDVLSPSQAFGNLLAAAPYVNRDPYRQERLGDLLAAAAARHPAYTLSFTRDSRLGVLAARRGRHAA